MNGCCDKMARGWPKVTSRCVHGTNRREHKHSTDEGSVPKTKIMYRKSIGKIADSNLCTHVSFQLMKRLRRSRTKCVMLSLRTMQSISSTPVHPDQPSAGTSRRETSTEQSCAGYNLTDKIQSEPLAELTMHVMMEAQCPRIYRGAVSSNVESPCRCSNMP